MQYSLNYSGTRFVKLLSFLVDPFFKSSLIMVCHLKQMTHDHPLIRRDNSIKRSKCVSDGEDEPVVPLVPRGGGTLGISGWGCAAGILEPLTYTRASSAEFCYPILE